MGMSETKQLGLETVMGEIEGGVILSDTDTVHLSGECRHVDRYDLGGPNSLSHSFRWVEPDAITRLLTNQYPNEETLCTNCERQYREEWRRERYTSDPGGKEDDSA